MRSASGIVTIVVGLILGIGAAYETYRTPFSDFVPYDPTFTGTLFSASPHNTELRGTVTSVSADGTVEMRTKDPYDGSSMTISVLANNRADLKAIASGSQLYAVIVREPGPLRAVEIAPTVQL